MTTTKPERAITIDPDRWRSRADGPRWLYAEPGRLRAVWRLVVFALALSVVQPVAESSMAPMFGALTTFVGERIEAYPWITLTAVASALTIALRSVDRRPWQSVALGAGAWRWRPLLAGLSLGAVTMAVTVMLLWLTRSAHVATMGTPLDGALGSNTVWSAASWNTTAMRLALLLAPAALWEELVFRGYLWSVAEDAAGVRVARWSTAIAFGVVHVLNPGAGVVSTLIVVLAGLCLGAIREQTGSLAAAWCAHFAWNWVMAAVLHVPVSGVPFETPGYRVEIGGPTWWSGGAWGPEGGAAALLVLGAALVFASGPRAWIQRLRLSSTESISR